MLHSIKDCECIPLDTHILSWMRDNGADVPSVTPKPGKRYREIEEECLAMFKELLPEGKSVAEKDLMVWMKQSGRVMKQKEIQMNKPGHDFKIDITPQWKGVVPFMVRGFEESGRTGFRKTNYNPGTYQIGYSCRQYECTQARSYHI